MTTAVRAVIASDAEACGRIVFEAFKGISERHGFPPDFPSIEVATDLARTFIDHPAIFGVVGERDGQIAGCNFLVEWDAIRGVGPMTVDPRFQGQGIGRRLMEAVVARGRNAESVRLVQDAFNTTSAALYASLGFEVKEPLLLMTGTPRSMPPSDIEVRPLGHEDLEACAALCRRVHGFDRGNELRGALEMLSPSVAVRGGRVTAYASAPTFWVMNHGVAETEADMTALIMGTGAARADPLSFLLPTRQASLFRWCLREGLRAVKPMILMAIGTYREPRGCYHPSVLY